VRGAELDRDDGARGIYAPLNDARPPGPAQLERIWAQQDAVESETQLGDPAQEKGGLNNYPCGESAGMNAWLNVPAVQKALHVTVAHRQNGRWSPSTGLNYTHTSPTLLHMYPRLIQRLKILLFSGDVDECVPYNGAEQWTRGFGYDEAEHWRPWLVGDVVAGYATVYRTPRNFTWATVRGAVR
jgi:serine carboxypeptidase-like clade 1